MEKLRAEIIVSGNFQGVFYRTHTRKFARELGLVGTVQNLDNGNVEIIVEGLKNLIKELYLWCQDGPRMAGVENVQIHYTKPTGEFTTFERK